MPARRTSVARPAAHKGAAKGAKAAGTPANGEHAPVAVAAKAPRADVLAAADPDAAVDAARRAGIAAGTPKRSFASVLAAAPAPARTAPASAGAATAPTPVATPPTTTAAAAAQASEPGSPTTTATSTTADPPATAMRAGASTPPRRALSSRHTDNAAAAAAARMSVFANPHAGTPLLPRSAAALEDGVGDADPDYLKLILTARVYDVALETPLQLARNLSTRVGNTVLLKREDLQPVFSFKLRGAFNRMAQLSAEERLKGVIACSAGNHAQGVALAAKHMGIKATIVMPLATPPIKWKNVERLGARVLLHGNDFDEAKQECARLAKDNGMVSIPPYDDPYVIAGQGTIAVEIFRQYDYTKIDAIFVCIGGGGLAAGIASYVKRLHPQIKIIGVETYDADAMAQSLLAGTRVTLSEVGLFADGTAVRCVGEETYRLCRSLIDEMVLVSTDEICAAIKDVFEDTRGIVEPSGALGLAGAKKYMLEKGISGGTFVAIASGANMNFDRLRFVAERADLGENREALISVLVPERPGSFLELYRCIHPRAVTEFSYRYGDQVQAHIFMSFLLDDRETEIKQIFGDLAAAGMTAVDASHNEMAKAHARYLVGGRKNVPNERLFRFSFPERPGALHHFLASIRHPHWNISLWHYRNYGGDVGKVMVGMQVPPETADEFDLFLSELKYPFVEETDNPVYEHFLK